MEKKFLTRTINLPIFAYLEEEELWGAEVVKLVRVKNGEINNEYEVEMANGNNFYIIEDIKM